jgi:hypothetical protein
VVVGVTSSFKPGIDLESCLIPRPPVALVPSVEEPAAATPESLEELGNVDAVGVESAPTGTSDVVVVLVGRVAGVVEVAGAAVESLFAVAFSRVVVGAMVVEGVLVASSICAEPRTGDFRISRCDLRVCGWLFRVD